MSDRLYMILHQKMLSLAIFTLLIIGLVVSSVVLGLSIEGDYRVDLARLTILVVFLFFVIDYIVLNIIYALAVE